MENRELITHFKNNIIVSCQALEGEPLFVPGYMAKMALAAKMAGAVGIRANSPEDIQAIKQEIDLPVIGIWKITTPGVDVFITPTLEAARKVYEAGAEIIAIDATFRKNSEGKWAWELIQAIKSEMDVLVMADVSTYEEGLKAEEMGADLVSTTLSGYTSYSPQTKEPDFELIEKLARDLRIPLMAEGKIRRPEMARKALELGAYGVIVGGAITRPLEIATEYVETLEDFRNEKKA